MVSFSEGGINLTAERMLEGSGHRDESASAPEETSVSPVVACGCLRGEPPRGRKEH